MSNFKRPGDLRTMQDVVLYVNAHLKNRSGANDPDDAGIIVGLACNDNFEKWQTDDDFAKMFDLASDLEWSNTGSPSLDWAEVETHLKRLNQRYLTANETHGNIDKR
jgi:hypothetical protein